MSAVSSDMAEGKMARALQGSLIGTAVGDSIGLPMEGLSARRQARVFPGPLRQRLIARRGMISDDTEHTLMISQALLTHPDDAAAFQRSFARKLRWWLVGLPAGVGLATLRAILKLWVGVSPTKSGIYSAGNGPAMRSAILGVYFSDAPACRMKFVAASSQISHSDPRAEIGAQAIAATAAEMMEDDVNPERLFTLLGELNALPEWQALVQVMRRAFDERVSAADLARAIGCERGVSGYAFHSVPIAIHVALRHADHYRDGLAEAVACGGDTDTVGAMVGALIGARVGVEGIPIEWRENLFDWPRGIGLMRKIAQRLARQKVSSRPEGEARYPWLAIPIRNSFFLAVVLLHGFRRLFPPY